MLLPGEVTAPLSGIVCRLDPSKFIRFNWLAPRSDQKTPPACTRVGTTTSSAKATQRENMPQFIFHHVRSVQPGASGGLLETDAQVCRLIWQKGRMRRIGKAPALFF